jgi:hypothetical protein
MKHEVDAFSFTRLRPVDQCLLRAVGSVVTGGGGRFFHGLRRMHTDEFPALVIFRVRACGIFTEMDY